MADYEKFMEVADRLGLKGEERTEFIKREIDREREEKNREREDKNRERDERALEREREKEEKALEREREKEERMEREKDKQRTFEREKEERMEKERDKQRERETQAQIEVMRIQLEIERVKMNNSKSEDKNGEEHTSKKFYDKLKLREFKPKEDKIENYVEQFEMVCSSNQINKADWATLLLSRLTGPIAWQY